MGYLVSMLITATICVRGAVLCVCVYIFEIANVQSALRPIRFCAHNYTRTSYPNYYVHKKRDTAAAAAATANVNSRGQNGETVNVNASFAPPHHNVRDQKITHTHLASLSSNYQLSSRRGFNFRIFALCVAIMLTHTPAHTHTHTHTERCVLARVHI